MQQGATSSQTIPGAAPSDIVPGVVRGLTRRSVLFTAGAIGGAATAAGLASCGTVPTAKAPEQPLGIVFHARAGDQGDHFTAMADRFTASHPNIHVTPEYFPNADYYEKIQTLVAGGTLGDALWMASNNNFYPLAAGKVLVDHAPLMAAHKFDPKELFPQAMQGVNIGGKVYGLPWIVHPGRVGLFYNKVVFDRAGVKYPDANWTYAMLVEQGRALMREPDQFAHQTTRDLFGMIVFMRSFGGDFLSADGKKQQLDTQPVTDALQYVADLYSKYRMAPVTGSMMTQFNTGKLATFQNGYWGIADATNNAKDASWAVAPMPQGRAGLKGMFEFDPVAVTKFSKQPDAAFQYVASLTSLEAGLDIAKRGSVPGARQSVWDHPELTKDPNHVVFAQLLKSTPPLLVPGNYRFLELTGEVKPVLQALWTGDLVDAKALMQSAASKVQAVLDQPPPG